jgi:hypothetical protein
MKTCRPSRTRLRHSTCFQEIDRVALGEAYFFDYSKPVYHYSPAEVALRMQDTVWMQCTRALRATFFTLPVLQRADGVLQVVAETIFDPNEFSLRRHTQVFQYHDQPSV